MDGNKIEKKIYELLGVNAFRKFLLHFGNFMKTIGIDMGYGINDYSVKGLNNYKLRAKSTACFHASTLALVIAIPFMVQCNMALLIFNYLLNIGCIMVQRYNIIRINEILKKNEELQKRRELVIVNPDQESDNPPEESLIMKRDVPTPNERIAILEQMKTEITTPCSDEISPRVFSKHI